MWLVDVDTKVLKKAEDGIRSSLQRVAKRQYADDPKVVLRDLVIRTNILSTAGNCMSCVSVCV